MSNDMLRAIKNLPHTKLDIPDDLITGDRIEYEFNDSQSMEQQVAIIFVIASRAASNQRDDVMAAYDFANRLLDTRPHLGCLLGVAVYSINKKVLSWISDSSKPRSSYLIWNENYVDYFRKNRCCKDPYTGKEARAILQVGHFLDINSIINGILNGFSEEDIIALNKIEC